MEIDGLNIGYSDANEQEQRSSETGGSGVDLQQLAQKVYEKLIRELEIENERLGQS